MKITIVGGGIGGLCCALSLHDAGFRDVNIYEAANANNELGVGINLLPHAVRELDELGLLDELDKAAVATAELNYLTQRGQFVWSEPRGLAAGYHWPQFSIHRGRLLKILYGAVLQRLGNTRLHYDHRLESFKLGEKDSVTASFVTSANTRHEVKSDLLIACDGVHSTVRAQLHPHEGGPIWNGTTMWRGVTLARPFREGKNMIVAGPFVHRVVVYPISSARAQGELVEVNWVAEKRVDKSQAMPKQDWEHQVAKEEVLAAFGGFEFPFLSMSALINEADTIFKYPMVDRDPLSTWNTGRVTLLGDAAHPMYPVGSNGASQAILDARTLAYTLATQATVDAGLREYDAIRRPATSAVVHANRNIGPEQCIELAEQRAPQGFDNIEEVVSQQELENIALKYKQTAGFDPAALNSRASLSVSA